MRSFARCNRKREENARLRNELEGKKVYCGSSLIYSVGEHRPNNREIQAWRLFSPRTTKKKRLPSVVSCLYVRMNSRFFQMFLRANAS